MSGKPGLLGAIWGNTLSWRACGSRAFDGRLGETRKDLLEFENFWVGWEVRVGETEWPPKWEDEQVCLYRLAG